MSMRWTFSDIQKECFQLRGELQNNTITGVNTDERNLMKKLINREYQNLASMRPPWLRQRWALRLESHIHFNATGHKNHPELTDSASALKTRSVFGEVTDGTYSHIITGLSTTGTVYRLDTPLRKVYSTSTSFTCYKKHYALPHNLGDINSIFFEDTKESIALVPRATFFDDSRRGTKSSRAFMCSDGAFTNKWSDYKFQETGVSAYAGTRKMKVSAVNKYAIGDTVLLRNKHLHTVQGLATTEGLVYLDRNYCGTTQCATVQNCPNEYTKWMSFYYTPDTEKTVIIDGYIHPQDMVADTDICLFPADMVPTLIIGALLSDKIGREIVSEQWVQYYNMVVKTFKSDKDAVINKGIPPPIGFMNRIRYGSEYNVGTYGS